MRIPPILAQLRRLGACPQARDWLALYHENDPNGWEKAWHDCHRGDWMMWLLGSMKWGVTHDGARKMREIMTLGEIMFIDPVREWSKYPVDFDAGDALSHDYLCCWRGGSMRICHGLEAFLGHYMYQDDTLPLEARQYLQAWADLIREYFPAPPSLRQLQRVDF